MCFGDLTLDELVKLRSEIVLNSLYYSDYRNSFDIPKRLVCAFFDGYIDFLTELEKEDTGKTDMPIEEFFDKYDNRENLIEWYYCHEEFGDEEDYQNWLKMSNEEREEYDDSFDDYYEHIHKRS